MRCSAKRHQLGVTIVRQRSCAQCLPADNQPVAGELTRRILCWTAGVIRVDSSREYTSPIETSPVIRSIPPSMKTKLKYVILFVDDVAESTRFYADAFGLTTGFIAESGDYGEMKSGGTTLSFSSRRLMRRLGKNPGSPNTAAPVFEIAFEVDDVPGALARALAAGATLVQDTREEAGGQTTSYVNDPSGYLVEICSPVATS
jgi:lactoylglutathione lyase